MNKTSVKTYDKLERYKHPLYFITQISVFLLLLVMFSFTSAAADGQKQIALIYDFPNIESRKALEEKIQKTFKRQLHTIVSSSDISSLCDVKNCEKPTINEEVISRLILENPELNVLLFIGHRDVSETNNKQVYLRAIEPRSRSELFNAQQQIDVNNGSEASRPISVDDFQEQLLKLVDTAAVSLKQGQAIQSIDLLLDGFSVDELVPVTTFLLSLSNKNQVMLLDTRQKPHILSSFMPIVMTRYQLKTDVNLSLLHNELLRFWDLQGVDVAMSFERDNATLTIARVGNPFTPSLLSILFVIVVSIVVLIFLAHRYYFHRKLELLADQKRVDEWLAGYAKASKNLLPISKQWRNQLNYWEQIKRESQYLEKQAKVFFDAGDMHTAKLFVSKALNINASAPVALKVMNEIQQEEKNSSQLSAREQWLRNKIAKAMSNFRNNNIYKALRQAYQAEHSAQQDKQLKKQLKAIKKLITRINKQAAISENRVLVKYSKHVDIMSIGKERSLYIGREDDQSSKQLIASATDAVGIVEIDHKALSRVGKHCQIERDEKGFWISDLGSTNGSYVQGKKLEGRYLIQNNDEILLGADSALASVALQASAWQQSRTLRLDVKDDIQQRLAIKDLAKIWPDYLYAMRVEYYLSIESLLICLDKKSKKIVVVPEDSFKNEEAFKHLTAIFSLSMEPLLFVRPYPGVELKIDGQDLLGKVPVSLPMDIEYKGESISIEQEVSRSYSMQYSNSDEKTSLLDLHKGY